MNKQIRIVSRNGKYKFRWVETDMDGCVSRILREEVDLSFKTMGEMHALLEAFALAKSLPVFVLCAANKDMLGMGDV